MPFFSNIDVAFYFDHIIIRESEVTRQKYKIFEIDILTKRNINKYVNVDLIKRKQIEYLKNKKNIYKDNIIFWSTKSQKYQHKNDKYIYYVLKESKDSAFLCNAISSLPIFLYYLSK